MASWLTPFLPCNVYSDATAEAPLPAIRPGMPLSSAAATPRGGAERGCPWGCRAATQVRPSARSTPSMQSKKSSRHRPPPPAPPAPGAPAAGRAVAIATRDVTVTASRRWWSSWRSPPPLGRRRQVPDRRPAAASTMHPRPIRAQRRAPPTADCCCLSFLAQARGRGRGVRQRGQRLHAGTNTTGRELLPRPLIKPGAAKKSGFFYILLAMETAKNTDTGQVTHRAPRPNPIPHSLSGG
jgi:hypothetical protein